MRYTVKLVHQGHNLSAEERAVAEEAFRDCLEFSLGGEGAVVPAYRTWQAACRAEGFARAASASAEERDLMARWQTAQADATYFALKPFGDDLGEAYFEVSI